MNKALRTADRWAPGVIALVTLLAVLTYILSQERVNGRLEGRFSELDEQRGKSEVALRETAALKARLDAMANMPSEVAALKNWIIAVYERSDAHGWNLPPLPKEVRDGKPEKAPVQPPGRGDGRPR